MHRLGWVLIAGGTALQVAEIMAKAQGNAALGGVIFEETAVGKVVAPIESHLPLPLGWTLVVAGVIIVWVIPKFRGAS